MENNKSVIFDELGDVAFKTRVALLSANNSQRDLANLQKLRDLTKEYDEIITGFAATCDITDYGTTLKCTVSFFKDDTTQNELSQYKESYELLGKRIRCLTLMQEIDKLKSEMQIA